MKPLIALTAMLLCAATAVAATPEGTKTISVSPEKEAVMAFQEFCVLTKGKPDRMAKVLGGLIKAKAAQEIPSATLAKDTGITSDRAWAIRAGGQQFLLLSVPGVCALHASSGDGAKLKQEFATFGKALASNLQGEFVVNGEKKTGSATIGTYAVQVAGKPNEIVLGLSTSPKQSVSGTKHIMTFSVVKKQGK